jgi:hypothetical protein
MPLNVRYIFFIHFCLYCTVLSGTLFLLRFSLVGKIFRLSSLDGGV